MSKLKKFLIFGARKVCLFPMWETIGDKTLLGSTRENCTWDPTVKLWGDHWPFSALNLFRTNSIVKSLRTSQYFFALESHLANALCSKFVQFDSIYKHSSLTYIMDIEQR